MLKALESNDCVDSFGGPPGGGLALDDRLLFTDSCAGVHALMKRLASSRRIFHSEADFQHAFAWLLHEEIPEADIRLEYRAPGMDRRSYIDIWVIIEGRPFAVELKYKTREMSVSAQGERYDLLSHGAQDIGRCDILKDLSRLEQVASSTRGAMCVALVLTNDSAYWKPASAGVCYEQFSLVQGRRLSGTLSWGPSAGPGTTKRREQPISLRGDYEIDWRPFSTLPVASWAEFRYVALGVS